VYRGECKRLIINIPPRYSKTEIAVVNFIAWCLAKAPDCEFIHASYAARLAANNSWKARNIVSSEWYAANFPDTKIAYGSNAKDDWRTTAGGVIYSTGADGTITGFGAGKMRFGFGGAIIIDDPHKANEANSDTMRQNVIDWYDNTIKSRTNSPDTPIIVIMQRLHEEDLSGWLLKGGSGEEWEHLVISAITDDWEALWPEKHDLPTLEQMKKSNQYVFAGQYMQAPAPIGGGIFKEAWWRYFNPNALPKVRRIIQSWDTSFKTKEQNDYSCCTTWAECDLGYYLLDVFKDKLEFPDLRRRAVSLFLKYNPQGVLVEDKASGQSLIQDLKLPIEYEGRTVRLPIIPIKVDTDKVTRAFAVTPIVEAGQVFLPEHAPWLTDYISSLGTFPNATHDDDVDSTTQALNYLHHNGGKTGLLDWIRSTVEEGQEQREAA
jgi:predicted phage terminase large subunit-like protein